MPVFPEVPDFFTVNPAERKCNRLSVEKIDLLCGAFEYTKQRYPFPRIGGNHEGYDIGGGLE